MCVHAATEALTGTVLDPDVTSMSPPTTQKEHIQHTTGISDAAVGGAGQFADAVLIGRL